MSPTRLTMTTVSEPTCSMEQTVPRGIILKAYGATSHRKPRSFRPYIERSGTADGTSLTTTPHTGMQASRRPRPERLGPVGYLGHAPPINKRISSINI